MCVLQAGSRVPVAQIADEAAVLQAGNAQATRRLEALAAERLALESKAKQVGGGGEEGW